MPGPDPFAWLARSGSAVGTAQVSGAASYVLGTADARRWGQKLYMLQCSGNSASAELMVPLHGDPVNGPWVSATGWTMGAGATSTGLLTAYFPWAVLQLSWVSGGVRTAAVNFTLHGGPAGL